MRTDVVNAGLVEIVHGRSNPLIDPTLSIWGWEIPVYLFLGGVVAGIMVLLAALEFRTGERPRSRGAALAPFVAMALISAGMFALFLDLESHTRVYRFYLAFRPTSPMSWGAWLLIGVYPALLLLGLGSLNDAQRKRLIHFGPLEKGLAQRLLFHLFDIADRRRRAILWASLVLGVGLGTYTGLLLGTSVARQLWNTALLGPLFLVSGVSTGAALLLLSPLHADEQHHLVRWDIVAIIAELALIGLLLLDYMAGSASAQLAGHTLLGGAWTPWFWSLVVIGGLLVPLALSLTEIERHLPMTVFAPVLVLMGGLALRFVLVYAGQTMSFSQVVQ